MKKINILQKRKGFSLVEMLISVFIFSIIILIVIGGFAGLYKSYADNKQIQKNIENAQFAINLMSKTIRTSDVILVSNTILRTFDYSHNVSGYSGFGNGCIEYRIDGNLIRMRYLTSPASPSSISQCSFTSGSLRNLTSTNSIVSSNSGFMYANERVSIAIGVQTKAGVVPVQSTVSIRN